MSLEEKFARAEAVAEEGAFTRVDQSHPIDIFVGLEGGQRAVLVVCDQPPPDAPRLAAIRMEVRPRSDRRWALILKLTRPELKGLFVRLVEDLVFATQHRPVDPGGVVVARLARWQRLLSRGGVGLLDDHETRGLAAELNFLLEEAIGAVGARAALAAWLGPHGAPRDFLFEDAEIEVKAVHHQHPLITISSLEQLTDADLPIFLWTRVVELKPTPQGASNSFSRLVGRVREAVVDDVVAAEALEDRLRMVGYEDAPEYETRGVAFGATACFRVADEFPRLQRLGVPSAIVACTYRIATAELERFRVSSWREVRSDGR